MHSSSSLRFTLLPLLLLSVASSFSHAAVQNRISSVSSTSQVPLAHSIPRRALAGTDLGPASAGLKLDSLMLTFNMTDAQQAALTQLLIDLQNPNSSRYHQWLTPEQFGAQFGLSAPDLAKVSSWLTSQGFTITGTARASTFITFSGTAGQVQQAFGTSIHNLMIDGEQHISNVTDPVLPAGIASVVTGLSGLNDLKLKSRARTRVVKLPAVDTSGLHPDFTSSITGTHYVAPGDFYTIYNEAPLISSAINGQGITVAVMGQTDINLADVSAFRTASGLCTVVNATTCPTPVPTVMLYPPDPGNSSSDLPEAMLDVEWAGATAPNAKILYVNSNNVFTSLIQSVNNNLAPIISISYGECELNTTSTALASLNQTFQQANAQGQTIIGPAGDSGATDCDFSQYPTVDGLAVDFPASSPLVTAAGGSMFNEGSGTYWNSNSSTSVNNAGSATSYIPETVWNETSAATGLGAGGGGASVFYSKPYWQTGPGVPNDFSRDLPDIALNAASNHDGTLYCVSNSCVNGTFRASDGQSLTVVGGTSVAVPSFAGILALVEQKIGSRIGNAGPSLYALANSTFSANVYHDITAGNNDSACTIGTNNCPAGGNLGYSAGVGYDQATGWGSVNAFNLATYWNQVTPPNPGGSIGTTTTATTLTNSAVCGVANGSLTLTIKVASGTGSGTPTGAVQLLVDNALTGSPIALTAGAATTTFSTAGLSSGFHTISALYTGDSTFATSKGYTTSDVVSSTKPDFAFTPCLSSVTAISGGTAPGVTFTITPVNGFTGTVTFAATSDNSSLAATYSFTPTSLSFTSSTGATTSFVLNAFKTNAVTGHGLLKASKQEPFQMPWYKAGSGAALACVFLLILPRRRRWGAILVLVISIGALSASGCGSSSSTSGGGGGTTTTPAARGTYDIQVVATATTASGTVSHLTDVSFTVQ